MFNLKAPQLNFSIEGAEVKTFAVAPTLVFKLQLEETQKIPIQSISLRAQIQIEAVRRTYSDPEKKKLRDLYGEPERWSQTLKSMFWTYSDTVLPSFENKANASLLVPCTYDFNVAATKFFYALEGGEVPLTILFSGSIFYRQESGALQVAQIPWEKEARFQFPIRVWKEMMDHYYPNSANILLSKEVFDRLYEYKVKYGLPTWDQTLEKLIP